MRPRQADPSTKFPACQRTFPTFTDSSPLCHKKTRLCRESGLFIKKGSVYVQFTRLYIAFPRHHPIIGLLTTLPLLYRVFFSSLYFHLNTLQRYKSFLICKYF